MKKISLFLLFLLIANNVYANGKILKNGFITKTASVWVRGRLRLNFTNRFNYIFWTCSFLVAQEASKRMLKRKSGSIFFTGASAGVKGFPNSSVFAMGKFGLRGLAQSLARELHPQNIHIGHFIIDGAINDEPFGEYQTMHPDEIAKVYLQFHKQKKSAWAWEIELRTSVENF